MFIIGKCELTLTVSFVPSSENKGQGNHIRFSMSNCLPDSNFGKGFGYNIPRPLPKRKFAKSLGDYEAIQIRFDTGTEIIVVRKPVNMPIEATFFNLHASRKKSVKKKSGERYRITTFEARSASDLEFYQSYDIRLGWENLHATQRIDYQFVSKREVGADLSAFAFEWAYSSELAASGFPAFDDGKNCLTNYKHVIPLARPSGDEWELKFIHGTKALRSLTQEMWLPMLCHLHGKVIKDLEEEGYNDEGPEHEPALRRRPKVVNRPRADIIGDCYDGEHLGDPTVVGRFFVYTREVRGVRIEITDSILTGTACRAFKPGDGILYAKAAPGEARSKVADRCLFKAHHVGDWRERFESRLQDYVNSK